MARRSDPISSRSHFMGRRGRLDTGVEMIVDASPRTGRPESLRGQNQEAQSDKGVPTLAQSARTSSSATSSHYSPHHRAGFMGRGTRLQTGDELLVDASPGPIRTEISRGKDPETQPETRVPIAAETARTGFGASSSHYSAHSSEGFMGRRSRLNAGEELLVDASPRPGRPVPTLTPSYRNRFLGQGSRLAVEHDMIVDSSPRRVKSAPAPMPGRLFPCNDRNRLLEQGRRLAIENAMTGEASARPVKPVSAPSPQPDLRLADISNFDMRSKVAQLMAIAPDLPVQDLYNLLMDKNGEVRAASSEALKRTATPFVDDHQRWQKNSLTTTVKQETKVKFDLDDPFFTYDTDEPTPEPTRNTRVSRAQVRPNQAPRAHRVEYSPSSKPAKTKPADSSKRKLVVVTPPAPPRRKRKRPRPRQPEPSIRVKRTTHVASRRANSPFSSSSSSSNSDSENDSDSESEDPNDSYAESSGVDSVWDTDSDDDTHSANLGVRVRKTRGLGVRVRKSGGPVGLDLGARARHKKRFRLNTLRILSEEVVDMDD
ncbi:hypothetical protein BDV95DRAFT_574815 [Massariosphaeria phaeospora]|uniref:Uncharacterized protein n=1 Tax=Massariosphaeria phaeospora TaxID=100035 RepID=A0A7C8M7J8_9PLEO|nr:hypothetical protein BDV95DRAFT_574815 [Massariosphaeria phaeospora]